MIARLRSTWGAINASYWFYPAVLTLLAVALATLTLWLDRNGAAETLSRLEFLEPSRPQGARSLLSLISGSMIGVAATVFSITIAAVAYASGTYGPRLLTNFMEDRGNQLSLATFIATFVYALLVLRAVRGEDEQAMSVRDAVATSAPGFVPQLSMIVAFGLTMLSVAVLVYLLNHIPSSIRINKVIERIGRRLIDDARIRFPEKGDADPLPVERIGEAICSRHAGYIDIIDFATLDSLAKSHQAVIIMARRSGDFVYGTVPLLCWNGPKLDDDMAADLRGCFAIGSSRTAAQDIDFLIDELVEIALRALSPGINDPFTAITALDWLGAGTAELAQRNLDCGPERDDYRAERVRPLPDGFDHFLQRGLGSAVKTVASSDVAASKFFDIIGDMLPAAASVERRLKMIVILDTMLVHAKSSLDAKSFAQLESRRSKFLAA